MKVLWQSLCKLSSLKSINLVTNKLTEETAELLSTLIINNPVIKELYLSNNNLQAGIANIAVALKRSSTPLFKLLDVSNNCIPQKALEGLADFISHSKLESFYLSYNNLNSSSNVILEALSELHTLTALYLDGCNLTDIVCDKLETILCNNSSLQQLQLKNNQFKSTGIMMVAKTLNKLSILKLLNIRNNSITEEATDAIHP